MKTIRIWVMSFLLLILFEGYGQKQTTSTEHILGGKSNGLSDSLLSSFVGSAQGGFEENRGQFRQSDGGDAGYVRYVYHGKGGIQVYLLESGLSYQFTRVIRSPEAGELAGERDFGETEAPDVRYETYRVDVKLKGMNNKVQVEGGERNGDYTTYYTQGGVRAYRYKKVTYQEVYPGIDWVVYVTETGRVKYDFVVKPGADPNLIRLEVLHAEEVILGEDGSLTLGTRLGYVREERPLSYQGNREVSSSFEVEGNEIGFRLGAYCTKDTLVIDPSLVWGTYYGGSADDYAGGCVVDASGNVYLCGRTASNTGIASGGFQNSLGGSTYDAFLVKFDSTGTRLWGTYYGGSASDYGYGCAVDASGNVYLCGNTVSTSGIASSGAHQVSYGGIYDAFLVKFDSTGTRLWSTYYGGGSSDHAKGCVIDALGNVYLSGQTNSTSGIASSGAHQTSYGGGNNDAFLVKFDSSGTRLWGTYYGGIGFEDGRGCAVDGSGNVYLYGFTTSTSGIATSGSHQVSHGGGNDAYLVKFDSSGTRLWGTYYGNADYDYGAGCAVDASNSVYLSGSTASTTGIASTGAHQASYGGGVYDAFLAKFDSSGTRLWGTYYGGNGTDYGQSCAIDKQGSVYLPGITFSSNNIAWHGFKDTISTGDVLLVKFDSSGTRLWGSYYGGSADDYGYDCAVDASGNVYLCGLTNSTTGIASSGAHQASYGGGTYDAFLVKLTGKNYIWSGASSSWSSPSNWLEGEVPGTGSEVYVLTSSANPVLSGNAEAGSLYIDSSAYVDLNGYRLTVTDSLYGTGYLRGGGNSSVLLSGSGTLYMDQSTPGSTNRLGVLTLDDGSAVSLGNDLEVKDSVVLTSGTLTTNGKLVLTSSGVSTYGQISATGSGSINGAVAMEKSLSNTNAGWRQIGIPVNTTIGNLTGINLLGSAHGTANERNIYYWDATVSSGNNATGWVSATTSTSDNSRAYVVYGDNANGGFHDITGSWKISGTYVSGSQNFTLVASDDPNGGGSSDKTGWNLVPNPYASNLAVSQLWGASGSPSYKAIHVWDAVNGQYVGICSTGVSVNTYNNSGGTSSATILQPYQAFWVKTSTNQTLTLTDGMRTTSMTGAGVFMKKSYPTLRLTLTDEKNHRDQVVVYFHAEGQKEFNEATDAYKLFSLNGEVPSLYLYNKAEGALSIKAFPEGMDSVELPLSIQNPGEGPVLLVPDRSELPEEWEVYLKDTRDGSQRSFNAGDTVEYSSGKGSEGELLLVLKKKQGPGTGVKEAAVTGQLEVGSDGEAVWISGKHQSWEQSAYRVYDLEGREVSRGIVVLEGGKGWINLNGLSRGVYVLKLEEVQKGYRVMRD